MVDSTDKKLSGELTPAQQQRYKADLIKLGAKATSVRLRAGYYDRL